MNEVLIKTSFKILCPLLALVSLILFLRGHNLPGGGFIGGLTLSLSMILLILSNKESKLESILRIYFVKVMAICLMGLALTALFPLMLNKTLFTGIWTSIPLPIAGKFSSILIFDLFIYLIVAISTTRAYVEFTDFSGEGRFL
jgi:multicomponent Na+:H+ antiporter subunit B